MCWNRSKEEQVSVPEVPSPAKKEGVEGWVEEISQEFGEESSCCYVGPVGFLEQRKDLLPCSSSTW